MASVLALNLAGGPVQAAVGSERIAYYGNWDIYGNDYTLKKVNDTGAARKLTTLVYSFENINPTTLQCFQDVHAVDTNEANPNGGDGGADAWGDYQYPFPADRSVDGVADSPTQALRGNFNQLKKLKQKNPNLKVMLSIGGWTFSKYFSDAAATPASRSAFVSSCVDMYIKGNLPTNVAGDTTAGGVGVAAGIFDGIDIDWEFPGSPNGHLGNHVCPSTSPDHPCMAAGASDTSNYTALMAEFRSQLTAAGTASDGSPYRLTAAVPSGGDDIAQINVPAIANYVDYVGIMSYDMHGAWEQGTGATTNFQAPLYPSTANPDTTHHFTVDEAVTRWQNAGMPSTKLLVGLPFYWRGWSGVPAGPASTYGLYQSVGGSSSAYSISANPGVVHYKELKAADKLLLVHKDTASGNSPWIYDNGNFYTGDTPASLAQKGSYIIGKGLGGAMVYSLESDDPSGSLLSAVVRGLGGSVAYAPPTPQAVAAAARTAASSSATATNGEPINMIGGNFLASRHEFALPNRDNPIDFSLSYSSTSANQLGAVGMGWQHSYQIAAIPTTDGTGNVIILNPDGRMDQYTPNGSGGFNAPQGVYDTLNLTGGLYKVTHKDRSIYNFNTKGLINTIVSANGITQTTGYNAAGQLTTITDSNNRSFTLAYDADTGMLNTVTDPSGRVVTYTYDASLDLVQVTNQANEITKYEYDNDHHLTKLTDPRNNDVVNNVYDTEGRVTQQTNGLGKVVSLNYATPGQTTYTDANGGNTIYFYDSNLRITKVQDALNGNTTSSYDAAGNLYQTTDPLNHTTTRLYDTRNNLTQVTDPNGGIRSFTYDANDNLLTRTDQLNRVTTYTYDTKGNVLTKKDPLNKTTTFAYDLFGQLTSVTDALNNLTGFVYDAQGNPVTKTDPSNRNTYYGYDAVGRMTAVETHNLHETDYALDPMDRVTKATDPSGHDTTLLYDADGNKTKVTDANNHATNYTYDANNNLTKTTNALAKDTLYEYDGNDNLIKKTDAKGKITTYVYDLMNRQTQTTDPLGNISKVTYDAAGNVTTRVDASNRTTTYTYDNLNWLITTTYPDSTTANKTYDAIGNVLTATNASGTNTYTYDANDHMLTSKDPHNATVTYTYNAVGSLSTVKYPDNKLVTYTYTPSNQLSTVVDWNNATTTYLYDNDAQLASKTLPNTIKGTYAYDSNGNLSTLTYKKGTAAFTKYTYTRDTIGNVTEEDETKSNGSHVYNDYTYDAANQLTMNDAPTDTYNYTYDDVGNMATSVNGAGMSTYAYNNANQLSAKSNTTRTLTYDPQGNQITDTGKTLSYNYDNQLKSLVNGSTTTNYLYDATGNRIDKTQTGTGATNYQYVSTGNNQVLQAKNLTASTNQYYLYGLEQISQGDTGSSTRQYPVTDGQGTARYLTNNSGTTVTNGTFAYDPYGKQTSGSTTLSNYMFQSEQKDSESGLTYLRARYYDSTIGRFTSQDPLSGTLGNPASQNGYNYASNDPINLSDPSGQSAIGDKLYNAIGLNDLRNTTASKCSGWSGIAKAEGTAALNLSILIPGYGEADIAAQGTLRGAAAAAKVERLIPTIKAGVRGGEGAGMPFSQTTRSAAKELDSTSTCVFCGTPGAGTQVDHAASRATGGNNSLENAQLACPHCNASKGAGVYPKTPPTGYEGSWPPPWWP
jgi:RHS repeat-associated protein